jgi:hypothetical protein
LLTNPDLLSVLIFTENGINKIRACQQKNKNCEFKMDMTIA